MIQLIQGQNYILGFDAWAEHSRVLELILRGDDSPFVDYSRIGYTALSSTPANFTYYFEMEEPTDNNSFLEINSGTSDINIFIDNISLEIDVALGAEHSSRGDARALIVSNYPNPFKQSTTIVYEVPTQCHVTLTVFDGSGRVVDMPVNKIQSPGNHSIRFDASQLDHGVYYYKMVAGDYIRTQKMILLH